MVGLLC